MRTSFLGYETGRRALQANQLALEVTGHNISNANAAGYSRQTLRMEATTPYAMPTMSKVYGAGMVGTGVEVTDIQAVRDFFLDAQVRNETGNIGYWETRQNVLQEVEVIFGEPQGTGIRSIMDKFWSAWQDVAANPGDGQYRQVLIQSGQELADTFRTVYTQLSSLQQNLTDSVGSKISEANAIFRQIADLNREISSVVGVGDNPNDLMDTRNRLTEQLSRLMDIDAQVDSRGIMNISVGGHMAVSGFNSDELMVDPQSATTVAGGGVGDVTLSDTKPFTVYWRNTSDIDSSGASPVLNEADPLVTERGELGAYLDAANSVVQGYMNDVETMAQEIVHHVNETHRQGYGLDGSTNLNFFTNYDALNADTSCAASMQVLIDDPDQVAAAAAAPANPGDPPLPGDGDNADAIATLFTDQGIIGDVFDHTADPDGDGTPEGQLIKAGGMLDDFFRGMIGGLGVAAQESETMTENQSALLTQIENQRTAYSGVSTDEELVNLIKYQQGYNAASRLITTIDEMVDTIINKMGLVGR